MEFLEPRLLLAANLFVATTGNDAAGTGSAAAPFATLGGALRVAQPGDTILVHGGHYAGGVRVGTPHLTIKSYPGETAVFTASVQDPHVQAALRFAPEASGCTLEGVELIGGYDYGLFFMTDWEQGSGPQPSANHELVVNCKIHDTGRDGVKVTPFCDYVTIRGCEIFNTGRRDPTNADGIDDVNADRLVVQDCSIHDVPTNGLYAKGGATAVVIERNFIAHCGKAGVGLGFDTDAIYFDTAANPNYYESINGVVRNNIITDTAYAGINFNAARNPQAYNNTLINVAQTGQAAILLDADQILLDNGTMLTVPNRNGVVINNIVVQAAGSTRPLLQIREDGLIGKLTLSNNCYQHVGTSAVFSDRRVGNEFSGDLAHWQDHIGEDANSREGDPGLDASFHLAAGSACFNAGLNLAAVTDDYDGNPRSGVFDVGADESHAGPALPTPPPPGVVGTGGGIAVLQFQQSVLSVNETAGVAIITVTRSGNLATAASVQYATKDETAIAGRDYQAATGTPNFAPGEKSLTFSIPVLNDSLAQGNLTLKISLRNASGGVLGGRITARLTIVDDDQAPAG